MPLRFEAAILSRIRSEVTSRSNWAKDRSTLRVKSDNADEPSEFSDDLLLSIAGRKPPSKRSRQILLPHNKPRSDVRPEQFARRARLVSAIAQGRRWLDDVVSGRATNVTELCARA